MVNTLNKCDEGFKKAQQTNLRLPWMLLFFIATLAPQRGLKLQPCIRKQAAK
jgi:hypothetical protein